MRIKEVIGKIEERYPSQIMEEWDNSGLQVGDVNQELKSVLLCLEITPEAIDKAIEKGANLIISHHPLIFPNIDQVSAEDFKGKKIINAIKNDIVIYASHTPADKTGFNEYVLMRMGFFSQGKIFYTNEEAKQGYGDYWEEEISLRRLSQQVKENLALDHMIYYGDKDKFTKVGLITGSGMSFYQEAIDLGIDLLITGDIRHHAAMDAVEKGLCLLDITHEGSERLFPAYMETFLDDLLSDMDIEITKYYNEERYLGKVF